MFLSTAGETVRKFVTVFRPEFKCKGQQLKKEEERIFSDCCVIEPLSQIRYRMDCFAVLYILDFTVFTLVLLKSTVGVCE